MILQDLAGIFLSSLSFFARDFFRLSWRNYRQLRTCAKENSGSDSNGITGSLKSVNHVQMANSNGYGTIPSHDAGLNPSILRSFFNSIWTSVTILVAALPLGLFATALLFADLNSVNLCSEWIERNGYRVDGAALRWRLVGDIVEDFGLFLWFPLTMIFLFGWKEFKANYLIILFLCSTFALVEIIYKLFLFVFNAYVGFQYHIMGNVCFFTSILCSSYLIAVKLRSNGNFPAPPPKILIMAIVCAQFIFSFIIGVTGKYFIIPAFTRLDHQLIKAIFAAITPTVTIIPVAVCRQLTLLSHAFTNSKNHFILAYFVYGATVILYRVMQADVKDLWLFIGLSVLHGLVNVVGKATEKLRYKLWTRIFSALKRLRCCRRMELQAHDSSYHQQLNAEKEIQSMLYDYAAMILSQAYLILYLITNFNNDSEEILQETLKRVAIGLGIDMFFNTFSILVCDYMYNTPVQKIWKRNWKVHVMANAVTTAMTIWYFTSVLLTVVHLRVEDSNYIIKNCTAPIHYWRSFNDAGWAPERWLWKSHRISANVFSYLCTPCIIR